ncbi:LptF/LptG family permease [Candidatus Hepatincolaceae symbiont of Richtersius coronifer]
MPSQIFRYLCLFYIKTTSLFVLGLGVLILIADVTENIRKYSKYTEFTIVKIVYISLLKMPELIIETSPFIILFSSLYCIRTLVLNKELDIFKASGLSIWKFLRPFIISTFIWGVSIVSLLSPLATISLNVLNNIDRQIKQEGDSITFNTENIWIIDKNNLADQNIILSRGLIQDSSNILTLIMPTLFDIRSNKMHRIIKAESGLINNKVLTLHNAIVKNQGTSFINKVPEIIINLSAQTNKFNNILAEPNQILIWKLYKFIEILKQINLSSNNYAVYFYNLLTLPFLLISMVLISARFSLYDTRRGKNLYSIFITLVIGFIIYFCINFLNAFGVSGLMTPLIAVVLGKLIVLMFSYTLLFLKEGL